MRKENVSLFALNYKTQIGAFYGFVRHKRLTNAQKNDTMKP